MQIIPFEIEHFDAMDLGPDSLVSRDRRPLFEAYPKVGPAVTLLNDTMEPIACAGVLVMWEGLGEFWMIPSRYVPKYPKTVWKEAKDFVNGSIAKFNLHRVQATVREADETATRWIERLGFQKEGVLRCFGANGENHVMYSRVKNV